MARITLEQIIEELSLENWKVISETYKNLETEMIFMCPEGHKVYTSWDRMRHERKCPTCKNNIYKENKPIIVEKKRGVNRILALDQASHKTGWSVFDGKELVKYGVFEVTSTEEIDRLHEVKEWLESMIENWKPDYVGIEGIQYQQDIGVTAFQTLARLQGILMNYLYEQKIPFKIAKTMLWREYCKVKGRNRSDKKRSMQ